MYVQLPDSFWVRARRVRSIRNERLKSFITGSVLSLVARCARSQEEIGFSFTILLVTFARKLLIRGFDDESRKTNADETFWNALREVWLKVNASDSGTTGRCATSLSTLRMRQPQLGDRNAEETRPPIRTVHLTKGFPIGP